MSRGWVGVDLDGTLAHYDKWEGARNIGEPIPKMVKRVQDWIAAGQEVRIFTARVCNDESGAIAAAITDWALTHIGVPLTVTCIKDYSMIELWDDRAVRVIKNTGERCCSHKTWREDQ